MLCLNRSLWALALPLAVLVSSGGCGSKRSPSPAGSGGDGSSTAGAGPGSGGSGAVSGATGTDSEPRPGVVVLFTETDTRECVPLCSTSTAPKDDPEGDDWSTENGVDCVVQGTTTGANQTCTTGEAVPPPETKSVKGVVVVNNDEDRTDCIPLCQINTDPAADPTPDDWSWENNQSCVIPGTATGQNQPCMTGEPIPPPRARPGKIVVRKTDPECVPLCEHTDAPTEEDSSDWAYEDNTSCLIPDTVTAEGKRDCTFGEWPPDFIPRALTGDTKADGFYTENGRLYDAYGNDFVIRGVNNAHIWYESGGRYLAYNALDNIAGYGTNTIRVVWKTTGTASMLADILYRIVELKMVPMVELHDVTGLRSVDEIKETVQYYVQEDVKQVLVNFRQYLLINIVNEWSGGDVYVSTYQDIIKQLRDAGIEHTLVIDADGFGQDAQSVLDEGPTLLESDPEHNLLFSVHMYTDYADATKVQSALQQAVDLSVPLIVGEFGTRLNGVDVAWAQVMASCTELDLGYIAWSWMGNDAETAHLDMAEDWEGTTLTQWGEDVMNGTNGIKATSKPASIFE